MQQRRLSDRSFISLMIDGKTSQREQIIVALGYDLDGVGHVLDMVQAILMRFCFASHFAYSISVGKCKLVRIEQALCN